MYEYYLDDKRVSEREFFEFNDSHDVGWEEGYTPSGAYYFKIHTEEAIK